MSWETFNEEGFRTLHDVQSGRGVRNPARSQNARFSLAHRLAATFPGAGNGMSAMRVLRFASAARALDLSKIEAGRMELEPADFDLPQAIDNALMLMRERAARRGIALHQAVDPHLCQITGDERKVKQVLLNLLSNALKFTPEGGRIAVRADMTGGMAEISVADTGTGIAPE